MLNNYLLTALRNIRKHFNHSIINIAGLSLGLSICLLLTAWVRHELSFDNFHSSGDRLYRLGLEYSFGGQIAKTPQSPTALLPALKENFQEVETGVRFYNAATFRPYVVKRGDALFEETSFYFADSTLFDVFTFRLIEGNPAKALTEPNSIVLSQSMATKYFGSEDPMGKTITCNTKEYLVTGIMKDVPDNSTFRFNLIASFSSLEASKSTIWWSANYQTFVLVRPNADMKAMQEKVNALVGEALKNEVTNPGDYVKYNIMPLSDIYLRSDVGESEQVGDIQYVVIFSVIAGLVLLIACINYVNLATARAADRAREVGVRKVSGALKGQLIGQFIGESMVLTLIAFAGALVLALAGLPFFNELTGKAFTAATLLDPGFILAALICMLFIAVLAGSYPAILIAGFKVVSILKGNFRTSGKGVWLRKALVVFQFATSIVLVISTIVILNQVKFIRERELGYDKENVIMLPLDGTTAKVYDQLKTEMVRSGAVAEMARASESPVNIQAGYSIALPGENQRGIIVNAVPVDQGYAPVFGFQFVAGENFSDADFLALAKDTIASFLLNESAVSELGLSLEEAVGHDVRMNGRVGKIKGVLRNFHASSMHRPIGPVVLFTETTQWNYFFVKLAAGDPQDHMRALEAIYPQLVQHRPFEYKFISERFASLYQSEERMGSIASVFSGLAVIIACLGLLGLVSFAAMQKSKEISIRKVMGASAPGIVLLITKDFAQLVAIAILVASPLAWYVMENYWLASFAYRTSIGIAPFVTAALGCLLIAFGTAAYQAVKAALVNPAQTLRND